MLPDNSQIADMAWVLMAASGLRMSSPALHAIYSLMRCCGLKPLIIP
jgi:hypothetical protein